MYRLHHYSYKGLGNCTGPSYVVNITVQRHTRMVFGQNSKQIFKMVNGNGEDFFLVHYSLQFTSNKG
jgi:hypothetical protein